MNGFFNPDNVFFRIMSKVWDLIVASLLWLVCCIPLYFVITITTAQVGSLVQFFFYLLMNAVCMVPVGPAMASLYYVVVKVIRRERGYLVREYFHAFRLNFKVGAITGAIFGAAAMLLSFDFQYAYAAIAAEQTMGNILLIASLSISIILIGALMMIFPVLSRFTMGVKQLFKTSLFMAFRHLPFTLLILLIVLVSAIGLFILVPGVFIIPGLCALLCSFPVEHVLKKYMPKPDEVVAADGDLISEKDVVRKGEDGVKEDLWYLE